jgi:hypothetical protein
MTHVRELIEQLRRDYRALLDAHGGLHLESMWRSRVKQLDSLEAKATAEFQSR